MCSPIISPLIGLWTSASMEEKSSPGKWAQPGVRHPPAPAQSVSTEYPCPHTVLHIPHASSPQLSTPLQMSPKATSLWGHWPGGAESHFLGTKLLPSLNAGQGKNTPFPASVPGGFEEAPGVQTAPAASAGTGDSRAGCTRRRNSQGYLPTASRAFPC